jgi:ribosomal protein L40E
LTHTGNIYTLSSSSGHIYKSSLLPIKNPAVKPRKTNLMARKSLGHVELEWQCPTCRVRNAGSRRVCSGCGAPQPKDVEFQAPQSAQTIEDKEKLAQATAGPDVHCPYCNARNPANATVCRQCGGDLSDAAVRERGRVVGALHSDPSAVLKCKVCGTENPATAFTCASCGAPLQTQPKTPKPTAQPAPKKRGCLIYAIGAAVAAILVIIGLIFFFSTPVEELSATAVEAQWSRTIEIEALAPVTHEAWRTQIPAGAAILSCREEVESTVSNPVPNSREVCGTPYVVDEGTGFGEAVQDCQYEVLADFCRYEVLEWRKIDETRLTGTGINLQWPNLALGTDQRAGRRSETLHCLLDADGRTFTYRLPSTEQLATCVPGSRWEIEINRAGGITRAEPR